MTYPTEVMFCLTSTTGFGLQVCSRQILLALDSLPFAWRLQRTY